MDELTDSQKREFLDIANAMQSRQMKVKAESYLNNLGNLQNNAAGNMAGLGGLAGHYGQSMGIAGPVYQGPGSPFQNPAPSKEDMLRDLMRRAGRHAGKISSEGLVTTISEHSAVVKKMLEQFLDRASYLQAQIPMVEAAFKDQPELSQILVNALNRAYTELCAGYFGDV